MSRVPLTPAQQRLYEQLFAIAADQNKYDFAADATEEQVSARADEQAWQAMMRSVPELANDEGASN